MKHIEGEFEGCVGSIYFQYWVPVKAPRALILLGHGAGEHSGRYADLAASFTGRGYVVAALDHHGHGRSAGQLGYADSFENYLSDLDSFQRSMVGQFAELPVFLLGHSMGGLIAALYLLRRQQVFNGAILSGPLIETELQPGAVQTLLIRILAEVLPRLGVLKLDASGVSRDPEVVQHYVDDPLVFHGKMSVRMLRELFVGMKKIRMDASGITLPIMILHGEQDVMAAPKGSRFLYDSVGSEDKNLKIYPDLYHEIFNEPERAEVLADVLAWCDARVNAA